MKHSSTIHSSQEELVLRVAKLIEETGYYSKPYFYEGSIATVIDVYKKIPIPFTTYALPQFFSPHLCRLWLNIEKNFSTYYANVAY